MVGRHNNTKTDEFFTLRTLINDFCLSYNPKAKEILENFEAGKTTYHQAHRKLMDVYSDMFLKA